jgi:hypothetical protein
MRNLTRINTTIVAALMLAMTTSMMSDPAQAESSIRITQSTEDGTGSLRVMQRSGDGLEVHCEGNMDCEIRGDDTVVANSDDDSTTATTTTTTSDGAITTNFNQSNTIQSGSDFDERDFQDLGATIQAMVDRLLEQISSKLANLDISV